MKRKIILDRPTVRFSVGSPLGTPKGRELHFSVGNPYPFTTKAVISPTHFSLGKVVN